MNYRKKLAIAAIASLLSLGGIRVVMAQGKTLIIYNLGGMKTGSVQSLIKPINN